MRVLFMGTPDFAVPSLRALDEAFDVVGVVTRPDAVRSRGKRLEPSPVKVEAQARDLLVIEANRMTTEVMDELRALSPDVICVAAYGCILPDALLELAPLGCYNVHASLLPRWRGAAPIQRAVLAGDELVGASIMRVVHELDAGAWCAQVSVEVADHTSDELLALVGERGATALIEALRQIETGAAVWHEQDESLVTYAHKVEKAEMRLDPEAPALDNVRRVQASTDAAPARCVVAGRGLRVVRGRVVAGTDAVQGAASPDAGRVAVARKRVLLGCADGALELLSVKPDGKREMDAHAWAAGLRGDALTWERA